MKYGEKDTHTVWNALTKKPIGEVAYTYRYTSWQGYHTNNEGDGLWCEDRQILGTCQFTVRGCQTEKAAKAKIRRWVNG